MIKRLRADLSGIEGQKLKQFDDFHRLIHRIRRFYGPHFPKFSEKVSGSHYVYNFGIPGGYPFTVVRDHGKRKCQSPKAATRVIRAIESVLDYIEANVPTDDVSDHERASEGDFTDE